MTGDKFDKVLRRMDASLALQNGVGTDSDRLALAEQQIERLQSSLVRPQGKLEAEGQRAERLLAAALAAGAQIDRYGFPREYRPPEPIKADF